MLTLDPSSSVAHPDRHRVPFSMSSADIQGSKPGLPLEANIAARQQRRRFFDLTS